MLRAYPGSSRSMIKVGYVEPKTELKEQSFKSAKIENEETDVKFKYMY